MIRKPDPEMIDEDCPEATEEDFARMQPFSEYAPEGLGKEWTQRFLKAWREGALEIVPIPDPDIAAVRAKTGMTQREFSNTFGFSLGTLRKWESRERRPTGAARSLLTIIDKNPKAALEALRG